MKASKEGRSRQGKKKAEKEHMRLWRLERNGAQRFGVLDRKAEILRLSKIRDLERNHLPVPSELLEPIPDRHALWKKSDEEIK
ncbi:hypothetical protein K3495_g17295 [Podosphaera aphanis]|nr:hypothetical protein K3495_g17295 [Podosphaera aphanis]